jgi:AmiR/NasT family two-component response regulator
VASGGAGMIWARKTDSNHKEIVERLRALHCQVIDMSRVGKGFPDLLVNCAGSMHLCEVKNGRGKLTDDQLDFHEEWTGPPIVILRTVRDAEVFVIRCRNEVFNGRDD